MRRRTRQQRAESRANAEFIDLLRDALGLERLYYRPDLRRCPEVEIRPVYGIGAGNRWKGAGAPE